MNRRSCWGVSSGGTLTPGPNTPSNNRATVSWRITPILVPDFSSQHQTHLTSKCCFLPTDLSTGFIPAKITVGNTEPGSIVHPPDTRRHTPFEKHSGYPEKQKAAKCNELLLLILIFIPISWGWTYFCPLKYPSSCVFMALGWWFLSWDHLSCFPGIWWHSR